MNSADLRARVAALPPEVQLIAACCAPRARVDGAAIAEIAGRSFDPDRLLALARAHRVEGFVEDGLRRAGVTLDAASGQRLAECVAASRLLMLRNAAEEVRLTRVFRAAGLAPVFVKGATLGMLAHATLALKTSWDIDLLVPPAALRAARDLLVGAGYRLDLPDVAGDATFESFAALNKETTWVDPTRGTTVELHSALVDFAVLMPKLPVPPPTQQVALARDGNVATLATPDLLAYVCVHGTGHGWQRLKWLADLAALADRSGGLDAVATDRSRSVAVAVWLSAQLFGMRVAPQIMVGIERDSGVRCLIAESLIAIDRVEAMDTAVLPLDQTVRGLKLQRLQVRGAGATLALAWAQMGRAYTPDRLAMPRWLRPWHALIWVPWRIATRGRRHRSAGKTPSTP